jgi:signal transduction histidine kinase
LTGGGLVEVAIQADLDACRIVVNDSGPGINPKDLPYIFIPFFSTKADGAGIDLAMVKRIMEGHGGQIDVKTSPHGGACFVLSLPLERRRRIRAALLDGDARDGAAH